MERELRERATEALRQIEQRERERRTIAGSGSTWHIRSRAAAAASAFHEAAGIVQAALSAPTSFRDEDGVWHQAPPMNWTEWVRSMLDTEHVGTDVDARD